MAHHWTYLYIQQNNRIQINGENTKCYYAFGFKSLIHSVQHHQTHTIFQSNKLNIYTHMCVCVYMCKFMYYKRKKYKIQCVLWLYQNT